MPTCSWLFGKSARSQYNAGPTYQFPTQTLRHVSKKSEEALYQRKFNVRHDSVLSIIVTFIALHIRGSQIFADLPDQQYTFPVHVAATGERPNIVIWTTVCVTVSFEDNVLCRCTEVKEDRYVDLLCLCTSHAYQAQLMTIQVGSQEILDIPSFIQIIAFVQTISHLRHGGHSWWIWPKQPLWAPFPFGIAVTASNPAVTFV